MNVFEPDFLIIDASSSEVPAILKEPGPVCAVFQPSADCEGLPVDLTTRAIDHAPGKGNRSHLSPKVPAIGTRQVMDKACLRSHDAVASFPQGSGESVAAPCRGSVISLGQPCRMSPHAALSP